MKKRVIAGLSCAVLMMVNSVVPANGALIREPYLQLVTPTSVTIVWRTDLDSADTSRVQYGTVSSDLENSATDTATISPTNPDVKDHIVTITGLNPATKYFYNVGTTADGVQGGGTNQHFFVTAPPTGSAPSLRAWVLGDSGWASLDQVRVRDSMLAETASNPPAPDLILHMGDIAYNDGTDSEFTTRHFAIYKDILRHTPLWPTIGNHESPSINTAMQMGPYYEAHVLPANAQAGGVASGTEAYYAFDYANVHFIVLDSMDSSRALDSPMLTWLQNDLASTMQEWVIAFWHHPPYSKGSHDSDSAADSGGRMIDMRERVLPILEAGGVDVVLTGHSHNYERSFLLDGAYGYGTSPTFVTPSFETLLANGNILDQGDGNPVGDGAYRKKPGTSNDGTIYMVAGHGGRSVPAVMGQHPVMIEYEAEFGSVLMDIEGRNLKLRNFRWDGTLTDTVALVKSFNETAHQDLNGDGKVDIVWRNTNDGNTAVWLMDGATIASSGFPGGVPAAWQIEGTGDVNGDGKADIIWRNTTTGTVAVWLMDGLTIASTGFPGSASTDWEIHEVGDVDGDGKADLIWRNSNDGNTAIWLLDGTGIASTGILGGVPSAWRIAGVGDVNGNGKADVFWHNTATGTVAIWVMDGLTIASTGFPGSASTDWEIHGVGDVDGDGMMDLLWRNINSGAVALWFMNGAAIKSTGFPAGVPLAWKIAQVGDINGNGKADVIWRNTTTGTVAVWLMDGLTISSTGFPGSAALEWQIQP